ncbi:hypothetical protein OSB04_020318 [Centaurea solstitialis]|uniref:Uncharacterized protein n=1 Tax=Centaurea solstitialis TaxID=347529 RepID=A0AA38WD58_9ASTR|nr:hypothetical protein OSB04_020318 [Centaurea solstitialis]
MSYEFEQPAITEFRLQITSMLVLSSANSSTSLMVLEYDLDVFKRSSLRWLGSVDESWINKEEFEDIRQEDKVRVKTSLEEPPSLELKDLPEHLEYQFLEGKNSLPVIISALLTANEKEKAYCGFEKTQKGFSLENLGHSRNKPFFLYA